MPRFCSELPFYALLQYAVRGSSKISLDSKNVGRAIKEDRAIGPTRVIEHAARRLSEHLEVGGCLSPCFPSGCVLVPMPRSSPLVDQEALWPPLVICEALHQFQIGSGVMPCLKRVCAVPKAAYAARGQDRPDPIAHYRSIEFDALAANLRPETIVLIDDFVTRGSSFIGALPRLAEAFPRADLHCFALTRTISSGDITSILAPVCGTITYINGALHREP